MSLISAPDMPWLMPEVVAWLESIIKKDWTVLETGAGGSTKFFALRTARVITYEHSKQWAETVDWLAHVELRFRPDYPAEGLNPSTIPPIDLAFIDGRGRVRSMGDAIHRIKKGGWLVLDDSNRDKYLVGITLASNCSSMQIEWRDNEGNQTTAWRIR